MVPNDEKYPLIGFLTKLLNCFLQSPPREKRTYFMPPLTINEITIYKSCISIPVPGVMCLSSIALHPLRRCAHCLCNAGLKSWHKNELSFLKSCLQNGKLNKNLFKT